MGWGQDPGYTQSYNRYAYCLNNPLRYTDPSGESFKLPKWDWFYAIPVIGQLGYVMQTINDNTTELRQKMVEANVPDFNVGYSINGDGNVNVNGSIYGQEVFNTANVDRSNAEQATNQFIMEANAPNSGGKNLLDQINYLVGIKAVGASAIYGARLDRWSMYKPLSSSLISYKGSSKYMSALKGVKAARGFGLSLTGIGIAYDYTIGVTRYNKGIRDEWSVSPQKAGLNTGIALYSITLNPIVAPVYFGVDAFYPEGWGGYMNDSDWIIRYNQEILGLGWNMYRMEGGLK